MNITETILSAGGGIILLFSAGCGGYHRTESRETFDLYSNSKGKYVLACTSVNTFSPPSLAGSKLITSYFLLDGTSDTYVNPPILDLHSIDATHGVIGTIKIDRSNRKCAIDLQEVVGKDEPYKNISFHLNGSHEYTDKGLGRPPHVDEAIYDQASYEVYKPHLGGR